MSQLLGVVILVWLLAPLYFAYTQVKNGVFESSEATIPYMMGLATGGVIIGLVIIFSTALGMVFGVVCV